MEYKIGGVIWYGGKDISDRDYCGKGCRWRVESNTLIIGGSGRAEWGKYDIEYYYEDYEDSPIAPWNLDGLVIEEGVTSIGEYAFKLQNFDEVKISSSVSVLGEGAFSNCDSLKSVVIPEGVTEIGERAFYGCKSLKSVVIPQGVTKIGVRAFVGTDTEFKIIADKNNKNYADIDGVLVNKEKNELLEFCGGGDYVIPEGVTKIGEAAFSNCEGLTSVVIPKGVTKIGEEAFSECMA